MKIFLGNEAMDLRLSLIGSAQCFSWLEMPDGFIGAPGGLPVRLWRDECGLWAETGGGGLNEADVKCRLRHYLDLNRNYAAIATEFAAWPVGKRAMELYPGLRVLNQPAWEALVAFILSANNNVMRIRRLVLALNREYGACLDVGGAQVYAFPSPERLAACTPEELRALGMGYRAPYLAETARRVRDGFPLEALSGMRYEDAHRALLELPGVGDKVADCVLLFGCDQSAAFPVDVWVERLLRSWFGANERMSRGKLGSFARETLGNHAGLMQQFLFQAARTGDMKL